MYANMHRIIVHTLRVSIVLVVHVYVERHIIILLHGPLSDVFIVILQIRDGTLRLYFAVGKFHNFFERKKEMKESWKLLSCLFNCCRFV